MPPRLPPFAALRAFDAIGRRGGIRRAAEELGISHAIVSRHLAALETFWGRCCSIAPPAR
jgi:DNA-binding transcriptional LysR family regulator